MNGKERTLRALNFEGPDRAPIMGGMLCHGSFIEAAGGIRPWWSDSEKCMRRVYRNLGVDVVGCSTLPRRPEDSAKLGDGRVSNFGLMSGEPSPFQSPEDVLAFVREQPPVEEKVSQFDAQRACDEIKAKYEAGMAQAGDDRLWLPWSLHREVGFHGRLSSFGYENFLCALALYEDEMEKLFADDGVMARLWNEALVKVFEDNAYPKVVWYGEDMCGNRGPMTSPELLHRIFMPHLKHAFEPLVESGFRIVWHSDGNIKPIREDLLDCGVGGFQGMQEYMDDPAHNNPLEELAQMTDRQGRPLLIIGSISCRRTLPFGTPDDVRAAAQRCLDLSEERNGGLIILTDNTVGPEVPHDNLFALYEYVTGVKAKRYPDGESD